MIISSLIDHRRVVAPIFVVGCCNSGTTILWRALQAHPDLEGPPFEGQDLRDLPARMRHFLGKQTFRMFAHPKFNNAYRATEHHYTPAIAARLDAVYSEHCRPGKRLLEKSPANAIRTRFLQAVFPDASFVMIVRNGLAVSEGIVRKRLFDPDRPHMESQLTSLAEAAQQWRSANRLMLADRPFLRRSILIRYEDLVASPKKALDRVLRYCNLDPTRVASPVFETELNAQQIRRLSSEDIQRIAPLLAGVLPATQAFGQWTSRRSNTMINLLSV
jgi:hypothetical protein